MNGLAKCEAGADRGDRATRLLAASLIIACACGFASMRGAETVDAVALLEVPGRVGAANNPAEPDRLSAPVALAHDASRLAPAAAVPSVDRMRPIAFASNRSQLQMQTVFGSVNGKVFQQTAPLALQTTAGKRMGLDGVGFPDIAAGSGSTAPLFRPLIAWQETPAGPLPLADVRCMGLRAPAIAHRASRYERRIVELAIEHGVSASLVKAVITEESCFDPKAVSPAGALGLMQLMPATAAWLDAKDPRNPDQNLRAGIEYLASLKRRYSSTELALAAYNAGPGNVSRYSGVPPFAETRRYIVRVMSHYRRYVAATRMTAG